MKVATLSATQHLLRFGVFELNLDTEELRRSAATVKLPPQPFRLLVLLASRAGQVVTREEIQQEFWGEETDIDFERRMNQCVQQVRTALGDSAIHPLYIETVHRHGYRFIAPVVSKTIPTPRPRVVESDSGRVPAATGSGAGRPAVVAGAVAPSYPAAAPDARAAPDAADIHDSRSRLWRVCLAWIGAAVLLIGLIGGGFYWRAHKAPVLTEKDTIVLADFDNKTGDSVFDGTLRQGLSAQLEQSPFLNLLSDERIAQTLSLMAQPKDARLTGALAREVCIRTASAAIIEGSIASLGTQYVLGLQAVNCGNGEVLADEQVTATGKEQVVKALGEAAKQMRNTLGESLASVAKFNQPLEEATTSSLEALQAFSQGQRTRRERGEIEAISYLNRALELDPNFAYAYASLGSVYFNLGQSKLAIQNFEKAYELRNRVSQRERYYIEGNYYAIVTGELEKAIETYTDWTQSYAGDYLPHIQLALNYRWLGQYERSAAQAKAALRLTPGISGYVNLMIDDVCMNRLEEAKAAFDEAQGHNMGGLYLSEIRYFVAFLQSDDAAMREQLTWAMGKPGAEDVLLSTQSDTEAYYGRFKEARELSQRAVDSARHAGAPEAAAGSRIEEALREVEIGNASLARKKVAESSALRAGKDVEAVAALTLARTGEIGQAQKLVDKLDHQLPLDTMMQNSSLPTIRGAIKLNKNNPRQAIEILRVAAPYELGWAPLGNLYPVYVRGQAFLQAGEGQQAAAEFQKILDHPGIVLNFVTGALAHLQLGRAQAMSGDKEGARKSYQEFLVLWKDADPDIPILVQAKAEYARLR